VKKESEKGTRSSNINVMRPKTGLGKGKGRSGGGDFGEGMLRFTRLKKKLEGKRTGVPLKLRTPRAGAFKNIQIAHRLERRPVDNAQDRRKWKTRLEGRKVNRWRREEQNHIREKDLRVG